MPSPELERLAELGHLKRERPGRRSSRGSSTAPSSDSQTRGARICHARAGSTSPTTPPMRSRSPHCAGTATEPPLPQTLGAPAPTWRLLAKCHQERNQTEYEGLGEIDEALLEGLVEAAGRLLVSLRALPLPEDPGE